ncbi:hypothetical protein QOZ80_2BG0183890 [Eleusine coracana subsp. coracana]|nr:hypothetical protein QOZ80_2BG0183890 [Eleusine coracana subsp. coracana]
MADSNLDNPTLPDEVLTEILARLPAKSAGRFRCVSRAWHAMLSSDYFVDLHLRLANTPGQPGLLLTPIGSGYDDYIYSWRHGGPVENLMPDDAISGIMAIARPCRGLVLVKDCDGFFVCNPSTGETLLLPDSKVPLKMTSRPRKREEYKVVRLFSDPMGGDDGMTRTRCEVFSLHTLAYWRPSAEQPPFLCNVTKGLAVFLHGYLHFLRTEGEGAIVTFNVSNETFGSLLHPSLQQLHCGYTPTRMDKRSCSGQVFAMCLWSTRMAMP